MKIKVIIAVLAAGVAISANAVQVTSTYVQNSATEIRGSTLGRYASPTVYIDRYACGEPSLSAFACGPRTISVGSQFLQGQENGYGNYVSKFILAHEWGHTIQYGYGIQKQPPYQELQADCVGGSHVRYLQGKGYPNFIANAVASARAAADYGEHGTPSQRDYYARAGYQSGFSSCFN